jgi:hypothetical protein
MQDASTFNPTEALTLLLQGPPGSGKTTLALQFPSPYLLSLDGNIGGPLRWLREHNYKADFKFDMPLTVKIGDKRAIEADENKHYSLVRSAIEEAVKIPDIKTIIIDNWTVLSEVMLADVRRQNSRTRSDFRIQDWGDFLYMCTNFVNWCKAQGKMVIFICHETPVKDDVDGIIKYFLQIPGQFANKIGGMVSDVWRCEVEESAGKHKFVVRTMPNTRLQLKQSLNLPAKFEMTWDEIAKALAANEKLNQPK